MVSFAAKRSHHDLEEENNSEYVDVTLVADAIKDASFWIYSVMLSLIGGCLFDLQLLSRSCECHKAKYIDASMIDTYAKRAKAAAREAGIGGSCVARGMRAKDLSSNAAQKLLDRRFKVFKYELLVHCSSLSSARWNEIMVDCDSGCQCVLDIVGLEIVVYLTPPLAQQHLTMMKRGRIVEE